MFMLGYAYQKGLIPIGHESLEKAIELNGAAVAMNTAAFRWGRHAAHDRAAVGQASVAGRRTSCRSASRAPGRDRGVARQTSHRLPERGPRPSATRRWSKRCGRRAEDRQERPRRSRRPHLRQAARYKDEYEVARLYADAAFQAGIEPAVRGRTTG
jgi:indolepyruvate ferredoxin oxidoreductase